MTTPRPRRPRPDASSREPDIVIELLTPHAWWTTFTPLPEARLQLACFPYAGGVASLFRSWPRLLETDIEVLAVQLPGRGRRTHEPPPTQWSALVPPLAAALSIVCDRPFVLFGHSLGALLAFEVARWLRRHRGCLPQRLIVAGRRAPHVADDAAPTSRMTDAQFIDRLRDLRGTPPEILGRPELLDLLLPRLRADFRLAETYRHALEPPLSCPITAFGGADDDETAEGKLEAWRMHTSGGFTAHVLPGDHFFLHSRERELLTAIAQELTRGLAFAAGE